MKCPYCYRPLNPNKWTHDPLLIPNGSKYKWDNEEETILIEESDVIKRLYKGFSQIREDDIIELQDEFKALEINNLPEDERTEFSSVNADGIFQITGKHIKEMRDSVGKLLDASGTLYEEYFNYDEDGNYISRPGGVKENWTDPITSATDLQNFQIKNIHIEDLRHYIRFLWKETFGSTGFPLQNWEFIANYGILYIPSLYNYLYFYNDHPWRCDGHLFISAPSEIAYRRASLDFSTVGQLYYHAELARDEEVIGYSGYNISYMTMYEGWEESTRRIDSSFQARKGMKIKAVGSISTSGSGSGVGGSSYGSIFQFQFEIGEVIGPHPGTRMSYYHMDTDYSPVPYDHNDIYYFSNPNINFDRDIYDDYCDRFGVVTEEYFNSLRIRPYVINIESRLYVGNPYSATMASTVTLDKVEFH